MSEENSALHVLGSNERMTEGQVAFFMGRLATFLGQWWPRSEGVFSEYPDVDEEDLPDWESNIDWYTIDDDTEFRAYAVSDQGVRFSEDDYRKWRKANPQ